VSTQWTSSLKLINLYSHNIFSFPVEYKGHCLLDACRKCDVSRAKKLVCAEIVNFVHPYTGDTPLHLAVVCPDGKRKQLMELCGVLQLLIFGDLHYHQALIKH